VELVQPDRVDAEPACRGLRRFLQVVGVPVLRPRSVAGTEVPALRRDEHGGGVAAVRAECASDELLVVADLVGAQMI
jgi:hypothetical protein